MIDLRGNCCDTSKWRLNVDDGGVACVVSRFFRLAGETGFVFDTYLNPFAPRDHFLITNLWRVGLSGSRDTNDIITGAGDLDCALPGRDNIAFPNALEGRKIAISIQILTEPLFNCFHVDKKEFRFGG